MLRQCLPRPYNSPAGGKCFPDGCVPWQQASLRRPCPRPFRPKARLPYGVPAPGSAPPSLPDTWLRKTAEALRGRSRDWCCSRSPWKAIPVHARTRCRPPVFRFHLSNFSPLSAGIKDKTAGRCPLHRCRCRDTKENPSPNPDGRVQDSPFPAQCPVLPHRLRMLLPPLNIFRPA